MASLRVGLAGLTFALFWLLSHHLNTAQLGGFSLLMNTFFMIQFLPVLGMTMPLIRRVAAEPETAALESSNSFFFALPIAAALGAAVASVGFWYDEEGLGLPFALLGLSMLPTAWTVVAECILIGRERVHGIAGVNLLEAMGRLIGAWFAIRWNVGLTGVFVVFACMRCAAALAYLLNPHLPAPTWTQVKRAALRSYLSQAPTYLSLTVVTGLCARVDIILLSKLLSLRDAGIYAAAARLSDAALMVPTMAAIVIFPTQSRLFAEDRAGFARLLEHAVRWSLIAGFAMALLVVAVSPALIHRIYTSNLSQSSSLLQILILGSAVMVVDQLLSTTMLAAEAQHADLRSMSIGLVVLTLLLVVFTQMFGLLGAAIAPPVAVLTRVLYRLHWAEGELSSPFIPMAMRVLLAAGAATSILFLRFSSIEWIDAVLAFSVYGAMLWATRAVHITDLTALRNFMDQRRGSRA